MDKRVVITGGCGFIGSHVAISHRLSGDYVTIIDNMSTSGDIPTRVDDVIDLDLSQSTKGVGDVIQRADIVYHFASSVGVKHVDKDPKGSLRNSFNINNNLFPIFDRYNTRVIFASTSEVYGNTSEAKETDTLQIGSPEVLRWGYACGKLMSEFLLRSHNTRSTTIRFFNVTGRGQVSTHGMVLPTFIERALKGEDLFVYGSGQQYRTFCDVRDAVMMLRSILTDDHIDEIYNIGNSHNTITMLELANLVVSLTNSSSRVTLRDYAKDFSDDHGEIFERRPNTDKIDNICKATHTIEDIIISML